MLMQEHYTVDGARKLLEERMPKADTTIELSEGYHTPEDQIILDESTRAQIEAALESNLEPLVDRWVSTFRARIKQGLSISEALDSIQEHLERLIDSQGVISIEANPV
ncbi:MAG: hypothetical protein UW03_C0028G0027 [Candidatus Peregrinibacteria bacterium GW2011_GWA2_43_8]|nr:MAG: hypothetical protein UW03_C0028G0027 [Candidatus Peregrinibacteria bacterium GW2011_GWA2_43_8]